MIVKQNPQYKWVSLHDHGIRTGRCAEEREAVGAGKRGHREERLHGREVHGRWRARDMARAREARERGSAGCEGQGHFLDGEEGGNAG